MVSTASTDVLRGLLRAAGLRVTAARLDVLSALHVHPRPLSHKEASEALPSLDQATVFRNLTALVASDLAVRVDLGDHIWRYAPAGPAHTAHTHPHFTCQACGETTCLDEIRLEGPNVGPLMEDAQVQIRGTCLGCR